MNQPIDRAEAAMREQVARGYWVVDRSATIDLAPVGAVDRATGHTPAALPAPRCWCGEDSVEIAPGEDRVEIGQPGERLCYAGHTFHEGPAHRILRKFAEIGVPLQLDPELWREREEAVAKLATAFDVPAEVLHAPRGLNHWATVWGAHLADRGPRVVPLAPPGQPGVCRHGDRHCPCPDGDPCHYVTHGDSAAMPCPRTGTVDCGSCP